MERENLTDVYTLNIRDSGSSSVSLSHFPPDATIETGIISMFTEFPNSVVQKWVNPRNKKEEKGVGYTAGPAT